MTKPPSVPLIPWSRTEILSKRNSTEIAALVVPIIADLTILGYIKDANQLVSCFYEHDLYINVPEWLYLAWVSSGFFPASRRSDSGQSTPWFEDDDILKERLESFEEYEEWPDGLQKAKCRKTDLDFAIQKVQNSMLRHDGAAVEIALRLGKRKIAETIIKEQVVKKFRILDERKESENKSEMEGLTASRHQILESRKVWDLLNDKIVGEELGVDEDAIAEYVRQGVDMINARLVEGPPRPYAHSTVPELVQLLDESYMAARKANPKAGEHMSIIDQSLPNTFLKRPATRREINALEKKLRKNDENENEELRLPEDYKSFLRITNGFYVDEPDDSTGIFYGSSAVDWDDGFLAELELDLFPVDYTKYFEGVDHITIPNPRAIDIGAGGDEGQVWLLDPKCLQDALALFGEVYETAPETHQRLYERVAQDLYGGLKEMRMMVWLVVQVYHWYPVPVYYREFRGYLEEAVKYAVKRRKVELKL